MNLYVSVINGIIEYIELTLSDRVWTCKKCSTEIDRDVNAALNIRREGCRILGIT